MFFFDSAEVPCESRVKATVADDPADHTQVDGFVVSRGTTRKSSLSSELLTDSHSTLDQQRGTSILQ